MKGACKYTQIMIYLLHELEPSLISFFPPLPVSYPLASGASF